MVPDIRNPATIYCIQFVEDTYSKLDRFRQQTLCKFSSGPQV